MVPADRRLRARRAEDSPAEVPCNAACQNKQKILFFYNPGLLLVTGTPIGSFFAVFVPVFARRRDRKRQTIRTGSGLEERAKGCRVAVLGELFIVARRRVYHRFVPGLLAAARVETMWRTGRVLGNATRYLIVVVAIGPHQLHRTIRLILGLCFGAGRRGIAALAHEGVPVPDTGRDFEGVETPGCNSAGVGVRGNLAGVGVRGRAHQGIVNPAPFDVKVVDAFQTGRVGRTLRQRLGLVRRAARFAHVGVHVLPQAGKVDKCGEIPRSIPGHLPTGEGFDGVARDGSPVAAPAGVLVVVVAFQTIHKGRAIASVRREFVWALGLQYDVVVVVVVAGFAGFGTIIGNRAPASRFRGCFLAVPLASSFLLGFEPIALDFGRISFIGSDRKLEIGVVPAMLRPGRWPQL